MIEQDPAFSDRIACAQTLRQPLVQRAGNQRKLQQVPIDTQRHGTGEASIGKQLMASSMAFSMSMRLAVHQSCGVFIHAIDDQERRFA